MLRNNISFIMLNLIITLKIIIIIIIKQNALFVISYFEFFINIYKYFKNFFNYYLNFFFLSIIIIKHTQFRINIKSNYFTILYFSSYIVVVMNI